MQIAIIGATGAVGEEVLKVLEKRKFPLTSLHCFASARSVGKEVHFQGKTFYMEELTETSFKGVDIAIFCAGGSLSRRFAPLAVKEGCIVIDKSSAFRMDPNVPLVVPEINSHALLCHQGIIASPSCTTTIMLMAAAPLHRAFKIKRIVASTYQSASGAGRVAMEELKLETQAALNGESFSPTVVPFPYAFNLFLHNSPLQENGYVEEELKMLYETRKILEDDSIRLTATCVRVPILRAHSEALNIECAGKVSKEEAYEVLRKMPGLRVLEDREQNRFPMPLDAVEQEDVFCGRIREDISQPNTLDLWVVGDQLLKGAALNAVQIAEQLIGEQITR